MKENTRAEQGVKRYRPEHGDRPPSARELLLEIYKEERCLHRLVRWMTRNGRDEREARDILQQVVTNFLENGVREGRYFTSKSLEDHLFTKCRRRYREIYGRKYRELPCGSAVYARESDSPDPLEMLLRKERTGEMEKTLRLLEGRYRTVLSLWLRGYRLCEIAKRENMGSAGMARKYKYRALKKLQANRAEIDPGNGWCP